MSQLTPPPPSTGISKQFLDSDLWKSFVMVVLEITIQAYQEMYYKCIVQKGWEEDHFTINLEDFIRPIGFRHPMSITVIARSRAHSSQMKAGKVSAKKAKELDIRLWGHWENYHDIYFVWECKRIASKNGEKQYKDLVPEYVKEGMFRFLDGEYSSALGDAGMLGYVLDGDIASIVRDINQSMKSLRRHRRLSVSDHLQSFIPVGSFSNIFYSSHQRMEPLSPIKLYHLFFSFNFSEVDA